MLAFRHDIFAVHFAICYQLADVLHHRVVRPDRVSRDYVHVGQFAGNRNGLGAGNQGFLLGDFLFSSTGNVSVAISISLSFRLGLSALATSLS